MSHFVFVDYAFSTETVIVGDGGSQFLYRGEAAINPSNNKAASSAAVVLLFSRDRGKPPGTCCFLIKILRFQVVILFVR